MNTPFKLESTQNESSYEGWKFDNPAEIREPRFPLNVHDPR
jgi:hypothetical protein